MLKDGAGSSLTAVTYENIKLVSPYYIESFGELRIEKKINDHARIYFTGIIEEGKKDSPILDGDNAIEVYMTEGDSGAKALFKGIALNVGIKVVRDVYFIEVEGVSYSYETDVKLKKRSFQNIEMSYRELVSTVTADYEGADFIDTAAKGSRLDRFVMQYNETDWEFLKRMASHFYSGLVPDAASDKPKFWFGIPEGTDRGALEDLYYSVRKKIGDYRNSSENYIEGIQDNDFVYYEVESGKFMNIGDSVTVKGRKVYVCCVNTCIKNNILINRYVLTPKKGLSQNLMLNDRIAGVSVEGGVIAVEEDNVKLHLEIDERQKVEEAFWFPYSTPYTTEGNTGWYCMPELNDQVKLYFPTNREEDGVVVTSVRRRIKGGDMILDPDAKFFRTNYGKEIMFSKDEIMITAKDGEVLLRLIEGRGIEIYSKADIRIKADKRITIESGKTVQISANEGIGIKCRDSLIEMDGDTVIQGKQVRTN